MTNNRVAQNQYDFENPMIPKVYKIGSQLIKKKAMKILINIRIKFMLVEIKE
ncbi:hypothetical protein KK424_14440 [Clostridioides difficile]|nr:hypothetical protein [Clostridioides difficile]MBT2157760.1 hypothetical protein [Clostridioides difficile]MBT2158914.1 hypothetical protein [Clostridioides difficile]WKK93618.1 hypothetical protein Q0Y04_04680 [Clostridioides difficile]HBE9962242.1 hypothetical protein [Clostridioides difficile]